MSKLAQRMVHDLGHCTIKGRLHCMGYSQQICGVAA